MPSRIGITARRSALRSQRDDSPWPSEPSTSATRSSPATASSTATASSARVSATVVKPARGEVGQGVVPVREAGPRRREDRPHADLDRAAVERVGAAGRQQHGVEAEGGAAPEDRTDVGVVHHVLEDQHLAGAGQHLVEGRQRSALERRQRPAVDVEAGDLLGQRLADDVAGRVGRAQHVGKAVEPARRHQERARREAGLDRAAYDLLALGQEQAVLGLEVGAQLDVAQVAVVAESRVVRVGDLDQLCHGPDPARPPKASG